MPRALPMTREERRAALIAVTVPLLHEHGRSVTTRLIAEAAGVAEGTIFRVFASKEELVDAAIGSVLAPRQLLDLIEREVDPEAPVRERMVQLVSMLQLRLRRVFGLMRAVGLVGPPNHDADRHRAARAEVDARLSALLEPDADRFRVPVAEVVHVLRLLTFAGSHTEIADGWLLEPEHIVDLVLHGVAAQEGS